MHVEQLKVSKSHIYGGWRPIKMDFRRLKKVIKCGACSASVQVKAAAAQVSDRNWNWGTKISCSTIWVSLRRIESERSCRHDEACDNAEGKLELKVSWYRAKTFIQTRHTYPFHMHMPEPKQVGKRRRCQNPSQEIPELCHYVSLSLGKRHLVLHIWQRVTPWEYREKRLSMPHELQVAHADGHGRPRR